MTNNDTTQTKCLCGCGSDAKSRYLPGHDARHVSQTKAAFAEGRLSKAKALAVFKDSPKLQAKLARGIEVLEAKRAKDRAAEKAAQPKPSRARASKDKADPQAAPADQAA